MEKNGDNAEFLARLRACQEKEKAAKTEKVCKKCKVINGNESKVKATQERHGHKSVHKFEPFTFKECGVYLQYKRQDKDPAIAKNVTGRRKCCLEVMFHVSPAVSPNNSDDEGEINEGDGNSIAGIKEMNKSESAVVKPLMGMGSGQLKDGDSMNADGEVESDDDGQEDTV